MMNQSKPMNQVFLPQDVFKQIMDYCDTRHRESLNRVLNDLLLVTDMERCENLYGDEMDSLEIDDDENYDMTELDPLVQKKLKGLFVRDENLSGFINNTICAREIYLWDGDESSRDPNSINYQPPANFIWSN